ncbi:putative short-chain dehydrogenase [Xylariales sp. PMI_506]|nr:putative short-chain dehydrogenase [Xylariales sp. PMI_506]
MMSDSFAPYAERYRAQNGPGDHRPTALEIIKDNDLLNEWIGRVALITGGTSGIGVETAAALHATGADVYFTARDAAKGEQTRRDILSRSQGNGKLEVIAMDMDSLSSVRKAAQDFMARSPKLNVLINNAGIMAPPYSKTPDGFERQFGVNHLAHYLLSVLLLPTLLSSSTPDFNSRVVFVSSSSHRYSQVRWDDYNYEQPGAYDPYQGYGQSKTAMIWTANYIDRHFGDQGVHALSLHPGGIWTGLQAFSDAEQVEKWKQEPEVMKSMQTPEQGAATTIWAAVAKVWEGKGGEYLSECTIAGPAQDLVSTMETGAAPWVKDPESEDRLWELSGRLVGRA